MHDESGGGDPSHRAFDPGRFGWAGVDTRVYKAGEGPWRDVTRQVLFQPQGDLPVEWRYFEVAPDGWSTLERHEHQHAVMILRGEGRALVDGDVRTLGTLDLVRIPPMTWHQFRAGPAAPLGFLCLVAADRDRPQLPSDEDLAELRRDSAIADFIRP